MSLFFIILSSKTFVLLPMLWQFPVFSSIMDSGLLCERSVQLMHPQPLLHVIDDQHRCDLDVMTCNRFIYAASCFATTVPTPLYLLLHYRFVHTVPKMSHSSAVVSISDTETWEKNKKYTVSSTSIIHFILMLL